MRKFLITNFVSSRCLPKAVSDIVADSKSCCRSVAELLGSSKPQIDEATWIPRGDVTVEVDLRHTMPLLRAFIKTCRDLPSLFSGFNR